MREQTHTEYRVGLTLLRIAALLCKDWSVLARFQQSMPGASRESERTNNYKTCLLKWRLFYMVSRIKLTFKTEIYSFHPKEIS